MYLLRRAALRAATSSSNALKNISKSPSPRFLSTVNRTATRPQQSILSSWNSQRRYATQESDDQTVAAQELAADTQPSEGLASNIGELEPEVDDISPETPLAAEDNVYQDINKAVASEGVSTKSAAGALDAAAQYARGDSVDRAPAVKGKTNKCLYVGNLSFSTTHENLRETFAQYGELEDVILITSPQNESRGFGYVTYKDLESAEAAKQSQDTQFLDGRCLTVQWAAKTRARHVSRASQETPCRSLYIGNISFQMTDKDMTELFAEMRNVVDVRIAIDRRSGLPRGFAHADFVRTEDAEAAKAMLDNKVCYGRRLRVDFSKPAHPRTQRSRTANDRADASSLPEEQL